MIVHVVFNGSQIRMVELLKDSAHPPLESEYRHDGQVVTSCGHAAHEHDGSFACYLTDYAFGLEDGPARTLYYALKCTLIIANDLDVNAIYLDMSDVLRTVETRTSPRLKKILLAVDLEMPEIVFDDIDRLMTDDETDAMDRACDASFGNL